MNDQASVELQEIEEAQMDDIVYAIVSSPAFASDQTLFAARPSGLYRSEDGGQSWQAAFESLNLSEPLPATCVAISPDFARDRIVFAGAPGGVLRSIDGGQTWFVALLPSPPPTVSALAISPNFGHDGVVLAASMEDGVFRSATRGDHWSTWNFGLLDLNVISLAVSPGYAEDETIYAGTDSGIFRSTNGGRAWREVDLPIGFEPILSLALSPNYAQDGILIAGTESFGLFRSDDGGEHWTRLGEEEIAGTVNAIVLGLEFPEKPEVLVVADDNLLVSRDGGQTWSLWQAGRSFSEGIASVAAPAGLAPHAPLFVGLTSGEIERID